MIGTILKLITEVLSKRLIKAGLEEELLKNEKYISVAKMIWNVVEENFRITQTIQEKLSSKADEFDKMLLAKFPELTPDDVAQLRQSVAGEINAGKQAVLSEADTLKQLQETNTKLTAENASLEDQLNKVKSLIEITTQATA